MAEDGLAEVTKETQDAALEAESFCPVEVIKVSESLLRLMCGSDLS